MIKVVSAFAPSSVGGLVTWYRGDQLTTLGGSVSSWADKSGGAKNALQGTGANQPTSTVSDANFNNNGSVTSNGSNQIMSSTATIDLSTAYTIFTTFRITTLAAAGGIFRYAPSEVATGLKDLVMYTTASGAFTWGGNQTTDWYWQGAAGLLVNTVYTVCVTCDGTGASRKIRKNGADITALDTFHDTAFSMPTANYCVQPISGLSAPIAGAVAEVVVYNTAIGATSISNVETYLRARYANY